VAEADTVGAAEPDGAARVTPGDVYQRSDGVATRVIAKETLLVPFKGTLASLQRLFALNPVAAFVWQRIDGKATLDSILGDVLGSFEVGREQAWADLSELVAGLRDAGLVREVARDPGSVPGA
jgi:hypothetical protein